MQGASALIAFEPDAILPIGPKRAAKRAPQRAATIPARNARR
jgi:hypothetical protein